ncbi:DUF3784 domain-containing protein [Alistipes putredinis]|uniref:DUF3784 domain-containing protein n=1 Tax=Alistipes putredinis TaxID=28117 RepID=UPI003AF14B34
MRELFTAYHTQLLGGGSSVLLGILVRFFPNLIVGYNTMSAEQKKNVDLKGLSRFMCSSLAAIGIGWITLGMLAGNLGGEKRTKDTPPATLFDFRGAGFDTTRRGPDGTYLSISQSG